MTYFSPDLIERVNAQMISGYKPRYPDSVIRITEDIMSRITQEDICNALRKASRETRTQRSDSHDND